jgi:c-di-GMP-related signal transduction protein
MDEQDTLDALRAMRARSTYLHEEDAPVQSPVQRGQLYEELPSRALVDHALDQRKAEAVLGWPADEVLQAYRYAPLQPSARSLRLVVNAVCADVSLESLEHLIGEDPVLSYRLLTHVNSAVLGLRSGIGSVRRALMILGYTALKDWCIQQAPHASDDKDVDPVRTTLVMRANLAEYLLDAGGESDMRGEIHLCGLFSQLDLLLGVPLPEALSRIPIADRVLQAVCSDSGPYAPYLAVARALEAPSASHLPALCEGFDMSLDDVNRALLRNLGSTPVKTGP